jgi:hypothetical protein
MSDQALRYIHGTQGWEIGVGPAVVIVKQGVAKNLSTSTLKDVHRLRVGRIAPGEQNACGRVPNHGNAVFQGLSSSIGWASLRSGAACERRTTDCQTWPRRETA